MAEPLWTSDEIAAATGGTLAGAPFVVSGVSIDSRSVEPGDLFVALPGVRDGHDFIDAALAKGAAAALALKPGSGSRILVADALGALEAMGAAARIRSNALRCAVTGSVGKTSVTQAVKVGLALAGRSHGSVKSYNNHIGVPLTLARMARDTERAVFEVGMNHADEITPLSRMIVPDAVAITTVGPVHTENFNDGETGVARAKAEIFAGLQPGGVAILNADNTWFDLLKAQAAAVGAVVQTFGTAPGSDARLTGFSGGVVSLELDGRPVRFPILQSGHHWGMNSAAVVLLLRAMRVDLDTAMRAMGQFEPLAGRGAEKRLALPGGAVTLIDESYNANPISMAAALSNLGARAASGRRIVVVSDMLELGDDAEARHAQLAGPIDAAGADLVFAAGPLMKSLWDALPPTRRGGYAETAEALAPLVVEAVAPGDVVMVKGSNGSRAHVVAAALAAMDAGAREAN